MADFTENPAPPRFDERRIGERIRELRTARGLSLRELSGRLEISASALSQIERGKMRPSVTRLYQIMGELNVPMAAVFGPEVSAPTAPDAYTTPMREAPGPRWEPGDAAVGRVAVTRREEAATLELGHGVRYRRLTPGPVPGMNYFESVYPPGSYSSQNAEYVRHRGHEIGNVVSGVLTVDVGFDSYELRPGDSITYPSTTPHRISNQGDRDAVAIWLNLD
ncbi:helix-turn-helix domain-containing protein [Nocardiopsis sp. B62]|uniref:helix-turn-helix domain-containing protein n=1 Tax=Nocardiopsis sp. B62 TaxID=2824874 RepID=UPI001B38A8D4|nr:cupin domain-containing protein [Nocardiopsis sp. B62]MBQ1079883.1 cupin domain-containing protein [Nocardiopsis sp. B62]